MALRRHLAAKRSGLPVLRDRLVTQLGDLLPRRRERLAALARTLHAVSPLPTLERGYSVTLDARSHVSVRSVEDLAVGDRLETVLPDGRITSTVEALERQPLNDIDPDPDT